MNDIQKLEDKLKAQESRINDLFRQGKIPGHADHDALDRIKKNLKTARRIQTMESKRSDPLLTERAAVRLSKDEYERLRRQADEKGISVSDHIRELIRNSIC